MSGLLVCVSFHFSEERIPYLKNVLENHLNNYGDAEIIVDTNRHESIEVIKGFFQSTQIKTFVHDNLDHPFHLAWMHRRHIKREIRNFDVFMYIEDDMFLPYENYKNYLHLFDLLWPRFIPSFIRTEEKDGWLYCADAFVKTRIRRNDVVELRGRRFVTLDNPYHAFWIMPQKALAETMNDNFETIYERTWMREIAASYGLLPGKKHYACWPSYDPQWRGLVEIDDKMRVSNLCCARHTTNKYINSNAFNFGKIRLDKIIKKDAMLQ